MSELGHIPFVLRRLWKSGTEPIADRPVYVSMNDYQVHRVVDVPSVWWDGLRLRHAWPRTEGALGLWFFMLPQRRSISVSIWRRPEDLRSFVRSPVHVRIMQRHKRTGTLINKAWTAERFDKWLIWRQALARLSHSEHAQR